MVDKTPPFTMGIEEEYLLVDQTTFALAQAPDSLIAACKKDLEGQVSPEFLQKIFQAIEADPSTELEVNLPGQTIKILTTGDHETFAINGYKKQNLLNGFDDIDYLINMKGEIQEFASKTPL